MWVLKTIGEEVKGLNAVLVFSLIGACAGLGSLIYNCVSFWVKEMDHVKARLSSEPASAVEVVRVVVLNRSRHEIAVAGLELEWKTGIRRWAAAVQFQPWTNKPERTPIAAQSQDEFACSREGLEYALSEATLAVLTGAHRVVVHYGAGKCARSNTVCGRRR